MEYSRRWFLRVLGSAAAAPAITRLMACGEHGADLEPPLSSAGLAPPAAATPQAADVTWLERGWRLDAGSFDLPAWFDGARVQATTRLGENAVGRPQFTGAGAAMRALGAGVMMRHVHATDGAPLWNSRTEGAPALAGADPVKAAIDEMHAQGLKCIAYMWIMTDARIAARHPEWVCKDAAGRPVEHGGVRGVHLDITSGWREIVLERMLELGALGVDGFMFDEIHMPEGGCFGTALAAAFTRDAGRQPPRNPVERNADFRLFMEYQAYRTEETFAYWRRSVRARYPEMPFVISGGTLPSLVNGRMTTNLARISDSVKSEFLLPINPGYNFRIFRQRDSDVARPRDDVRLAAGYALMRDAAEGRPPRIWGAGFEDDGEWTAFAGAVMTWGCIADVNMPEGDIIPGPRARQDRRRNFADVFALGARLAPHLGGTRPVRWAAVHFSELARNARGADHVAAWRDTLWPAVGAFGGLVDLGVPVGFVNDDQLSRGALDGYRLLFLPTPGELTTAQRAAVDRFRAAGGTVLQNDTAWRWHDAAATSAAAEAFRRAVAPSVADAVVRATWTAGRVHAVPVRARAGRIVTCLTNDFSWVTIDRPTLTRRQQARNETQRRQTPRRAAAAPAGPVEVTVRGSASPQRAFDAVTGRALAVRAASGGHTVTVPSLEQFAVIVTE